jgi:hypothetical protein
VDLRYVPLSLRSIDALRSELAVLPFFEDERPLRAAAGLCDWRLCGRLSRLIESGRVVGTLGESLLCPAGPRLPFERLLLVGVGPRDRFDDRAFELANSKVLAALMGLRVRNVAVSIPGRSVGLLAAEDAGRRFLAAIAAGADELDELALLDEPDALRAMAPGADAERRRQRAHGPA